MYINAVCLLISHIADCNLPMNQYIELRYMAMRRPPRQGDTALFLQIVLFYEYLLLEDTTFAWTDNDITYT